jgi:hypothetical protein
MTERPALSSDRHDDRRAPAIGHFGRFAAVVKTEDLFATRQRSKKKSGDCDS